MDVTYLFSLFCRLIFFFFFAFFLRHVGTFLGFFWMLIGTLDADDIAVNDPAFSTTQTFGRIYISFYIVCMVIVALSMLVAMMNASFEKIMVSFKTWYDQRRITRRLTQFRSLHQFSSPSANYASRLAQLVEHRTTVREVVGSGLRPRPDQHSGSLNN